MNEGRTSRYIREREYGFRAPRGFRRYTRGREVSQRFPRVVSRLQRRLSRARGRIAVRDRAHIARIRLTRAQLRRRGIIAARGFSAYPAPR